MIIAYMTLPTSPLAPPVLCMLAEKPDQFSLPLPVEAMIETKAAVCRLGPQEGIKIRHDDTDNSLLIDPVIPGKIFVTPSLPDRPGFNVGRLKIRRDNGNLTVFFMPEKGPQEWREWRPNELENI